ncbi:MAG TPA: PLP-dependent aminotransferase family protein, partial [Dongiaceae bacterium]|nr:PLP-dependent aminotransferase family protein [Dongiaceae bacterium]
YVEACGTRGTVVAHDPPRTALDRPPRARASASPPRPGGRISREGRAVRRFGEIFAPLTRVERTGLRWDFRYNASVADPTSRRAWTRIARRRARSHETSPPPWNPARRPGLLNELLARHLALTRGVRCEPRQIVLVGSPQSAFHLAAWLLLEPGDLVAMEDPHYLGVRHTFLARGARVQPVPVDERGLRTDLLPRGRGARLVYTTPSHQWPTGAALPLARRYELLEWARRERAWIVENDHNCEHLYEGTAVESVQGLDESDRVIHVGTFSRLLDPYPSIAYVVVPTSLIDVFRGATNLDGASFSALEIETLAEFISGGHLERLLRRASRRMRALRKCLLDALRELPAPVAVRPSTGGLHLYVRLPGWSGQDVDDLVRLAAGVGVGIYPGAPFYLRPPATPGFLLGFAQMRPEDIREGLARLAPLLRER